MKEMSSLLTQNNQVEWETRCRQEDMKQRALENERRAIDDARRLVDEKAQQLKSLSHQSALIAGFSMVVIVEIEIPEDLHPVLLVAFGSTTALVVSLMLISMLNATFILVAILRYDCVRRERSFKQFWTTRCDSDWKLALRAFVSGVWLFCLVLAQIGWVKLWQYDEIGWFCASSVISFIAVSTVMIFAMRIDRKWRGWLLARDPNLVNRQA